MKLQHLLRIAILIIAFSAHGFYLGIYAQQNTTINSDVTNFVRKIYIHGLPFETANKFGKSDVPILIKMLNDTSERKYWSNIVITLGIIGDERVVAPLINIIEEGENDTLLHEEYIAKTSALISFGYLINKTNNQKALNYLIEGTNLNTWEKKELKWNSPYQFDIQDRNKQLSIMSIIGLSLSGNTKAGSTLKSLKKPTSEKLLKNRDAIGVDFIIKAAREHKKISKKGLVKYNRLISKKCQCNQ